MPQARTERLIKIKSIINKEGEPRFAVYDTEGNRYGGFKQWEKQNTLEYSQLLHGNHNEPFKAGDEALVQFIRSDDGKYLNLKGLFPAGTSPRPSKAESSNLGHSGASGGASRDEFSRRLGIQGHLNALLSNPEVCKAVAQRDSLIAWAITIEDELEKKLSATAKPVANPEPELPTIQIEGDIGEDIPF